MIIIPSKRLFFKKKNIWFAESPFDVDDCDIVLFFSCRKNVDRPDFEKKESPTLIIDLKKDLDEIWKNMGNKSCRYFIKRAAREGIEVRKNTEQNTFMALYSDFTKEKNFHSIIVGKDALKKYATFFTAFYDSELLAGIILVEDSKNARWLLGGSKRLEADKKKSVLISCANRLLIWEAIKYAKEKGLEAFDFGGYYLGTDKDNPLHKINQFKRQFGGALVIYYNYTKYYSKIYRSIKTMKQKIL